jgi:DNA-binding CsgD family transcriptional regulator
MPGVERDDMAERRAEETSHPIHVVTARQRQVLDLIAQGQTTKAMSAALGITERGVAAQVSRLLRKFGVANRAGLIAAVLTELTADEEPPRPLRSWTDLSAVARLLGTDLGALRKAPFHIAVTLGRNHLTGFLSEQAERTLGVSIRMAFGMNTSHLFAQPDPELAARMDRSFSSGAAVLMDRVPFRWTRDDGTPMSNTFTCIVQPLRGTDGAVHGTLFVCIPPA